MRPGDRPGAHARTLAGPREDPIRRPRQGRKRRPWVQVALPESRVFQAVVPITDANRSSHAAELLHGGGAGDQLRAEERIIDLIKLELDKQPLACLAASPALVTELIEMLERLGPRVAMIEPAPAGLFRAGEHLKKRPGARSCALRFFLGRTQASAYWRWACSRSSGIRSTCPPRISPPRSWPTYSTLWMQGRHSRITVPIDTVVIHGRPDLECRSSPRSFRERTGAPAAPLRRAGYEPVGGGDGHGPGRSAHGCRRARPAPSQAGGPDPGDLPWGELVLQGRWSRGCRCSSMPARWSSRRN